jgi:glyceraldehyde 3-phosphate dehydrogenase
MENGTQKARVAINGFGRIGRTFFRMAYDNPDFEIVAVNDLASLENLVYLLNYDTVYGHAPFTARAEDGGIRIDDRKITLLSEREPEKLPWKDMDIDVVIEATGVFAGYEKSKAHLTAGAKRVVISAPVKDDPAAAGVTGATVLMGVNDDVLGTCQITSNASCTTNATSPIIGIMKEAIGIRKAVLNTVHAYTASQAIVDGPAKKDLREGRAAAQNIVPTSTGAAVATTKAHTDLEGKFDGISIRVPVPVGSIADVTFIAARQTSAEEVNEIMRNAAASPAWQDVFAVTDEPIVSSDIIGAHYGAIADLSMTRVVDGDLVKILAWYDNETGYTSTLVKHVTAVVKAL